MKWSYKTVHFELKKEGLLGAGVLDESEIEHSLNEFGKSGWELVSLIEVQDGVMAFFKQPLGMDLRYHYREETVDGDSQAGGKSPILPDTEEADEPEEAADDTIEQEPARRGNLIGAIRIE